MDLITDRTESDVLLKTEKGTYGYKDLNRVEDAVKSLQELAVQLDIPAVLITKTDWGLPGAFDAAAWPTQSQMRRYLQNVSDLCDAVAVNATLPKSMQGLTWMGANSIEEALSAVHIRIQGVLHAFKYSGECFAGEE